VLRLFQRVRDGRPWRSAHLELRDGLVHALQVGIDGRPIVATHRDRKGDVEKLGWHVMPKLAEALLRLRGRRRGFKARFRRRRPIVGHRREYAQTRACPAVRWPSGVPRFSTAPSYERPEALPVVATLRTVCEEARRAYWCRNRADARVHG